MCVLWPTDRILMQCLSAKFKGTFPKTTVCLRELYFKLVKHFLSASGSLRLWTCFMYLMFKFTLNKRLLDDVCWWALGFRWLNANVKTKGWLFDTRALLQSERGLWTCRGEASAHRTACSRWHLLWKLSHHTGLEICKHLFLQIKAVYPDVKDVQCLGNSVVLLVRCLTWLIKKKDCDVTRIAVPGRSRQGALIGVVLFLVDF